MQVSKNSRFHIVSGYYVQATEVLSKLYAAHQENKKTVGVDIEVSQWCMPNEKVRHIAFKQWYIVWCIIY